MPAIKVSEFVYGRLQSPDLDQAETFLSEFGMVRAARTMTALYMRGTDPAHHIHITELGEPRFLGLGFAVSDPDDLKRLVQLPGASGIESIDEPGGGRRVRLTDPDGHRVEIVHGIEAVKALDVPRQAVNSGAHRPRNGEFQRPPRGPAHVKRLGHGVMMTTDLRRKVAWYRDTLGFLASDDVYAGTPDNLIGSFNRLDRGESFVDHHVFFCIQGKKAGLNHLAFEVQDVDDVMIGHNHLRQKGYAHVWGVGRHELGSHIYDYWQDPWGRVHEHWTDTDTLNAHALPGLHGTDALNGPLGRTDPSLLCRARLGLIPVPFFPIGAERPLTRGVTMIVVHIDSSPRGVDSVSRCLTGQIVDRLKAVEPTLDGRANGLADAVSAIEQMLDGCVEQAA